LLPLIPDVGEDGDHIRAVPLGCGWMILPDREFGGSVLSDPLGPAQKTARSRRMNIDVISTAISQSTLQQPLDNGAVAYVA
jgi:hypothetical protein